MQTVSVYVCVCVCVLAQWETIKLRAKFMFTRRIT
jgi:hypothetical protein